RGQKRGRREAGAVDDRIDTMQLPVARTDAVRLDALDRRVHQLDVRPYQRVVPFVRHQLALAAHRVVRRELRPQHRILDFRLQQLAKRRLGGESQMRLPLPAPDEALEHEENLQARQPAQAWMALQPLIPLAGARENAFRHDVLRRALEQVELRYLARNLGNELNRAGAVADHRHAFASELIGVVPARRVELHALELIAARDVGSGWIVEQSDGRDQ